MAVAGRGPLQHSPGHAHAHTCAHREIEIGIPNARSRADILTRMLSALPHALSDGDIEAAAGATHGYVGADLSLVCQHAAMCALKRHVASGGAGGVPAIGAGDLRAAVAATGPSALREVLVDVPSVRACCVECAGGGGGWRACSRSCG